MRFGIAVFGLAVALPLLSFAPPAPAASGPPEFVTPPPETSARVPPVNFAPVAHYHVMAGAPFEAEEITEHAQTLANGTHINQTFKARSLYRNNAGKVRIETTIMVGTRPEPGPRVIEIWDPENRLYLALDQYRQIAHRLELGVAEETFLDGGQVTLEGQVIKHAPGPEGDAMVTEQDLGEKVIEGVAVKGHRISVTIPEGSIGNDRPLTQNTDRWFSEPLQLDVLTTRDDPRDGLLTIKMTKIRQVEPDPALFQIPAGYQVVDESGRFAINLNRPRVFKTRESGK